MKEFDKKLWEIQLFSSKGESWGHTGLFSIGSHKYEKFKNRLKVIREHILRNQLL